RGFFDYAEGAVRPDAATEAPQPAPARIAMHGDAGIASPLRGRTAPAGIAVERLDALAAFPDGALRVGDALLALSDGRTATVRAAATGSRNLVLFDLALDFAACKRIALACADGCSPLALAAATGAAQAAGIAASRI